MITNNKRGLEITVNFLIIIIITVILFGIALYFAGVIFDVGQEIGGDIDRRTDEQIELLINSQNAIVAIPFNLIESDVNEFVVFGVGVRNVGAQADFGLVANFQGAYHLDGREMTGVDPSFMNLEWLGNSVEQDLGIIDSQEVLKYGLIVEAFDRVNENEATEPGDYAFNVCIYDKAKGKPSCQLESISTENQLLYPPGKMFTITIRVE